MSFGAQTALRCQPTPEGTAINLLWDVFESDNGYVIYHSTDGKNYKKLVHLGKGSSKYLHTGLKPGETHYYKLAVIDTDGTESPPSPPIGVTCAYPVYKERTQFFTQQSYFEPPKESTPPLTVNAKKDGELILSWKTASTDMGYVIYHSTNKLGPYNRLVRLPKGSTTYIHKGLGSGETHYYRIGFLDDLGVEYALSETIEATTTTLSGTKKKKLERPKAHTIRTDDKKS
jgi:fibronectin type 3 domain-containing protein